MRRQRVIKRQIRVRPIKKKIYVFLEGKNSEPGYLETYSRLYPGVLAGLELKRAQGVPATLVSKAVELKKTISRRSYIEQNGKNDEIWVVCDRDAHPNYHQSIAQAHSQGIKVAASNPCFELWLILHFKEVDAALNHHEIQSLCQKEVPGYQKRACKVPDLDKVIPLHRDAEERAKKLLSLRQADGAAAPMTTFHELLISIRS